MLEIATALELALAFNAGDDGLAAKSRELVVQLLRHTAEPFSRNQFAPGHITCTALVLSPEGSRILLMFHHRHRRWLLPGGHVETSDSSLMEAARREAVEETGIVLSTPLQDYLVGMDVHAIPARKDEPYHLHHDLVFAMQAAEEEFSCTEEAPSIAWCDPNDFDRYQLPANIVRSAGRAQRSLRVSG